MKILITLLAITLFSALATAQSFTTQLPDLVVSSIDVPDAVRAGESLAGIPFTIKNNGPGILSYGPIFARVELTTAQGGSICQVVETIRNTPTKTYGFVRHRTTLHIPVGASVQWTSEARECRVPVTGPINIKVTIDPAGTTRVKPRGYVPETNDQNNDLTKVVMPSKIVEDVKRPDTVTLNLEAGTNIFSTGLLTEMTGDEFLLKTGCSRLEETTPEKAAIPGRKPAPLRDTVFSRAAVNQPLNARAIYRADCPTAAAIDITGYDPGPFLMTLADGMITPVPSRANMRGNLIWNVGRCDGLRAYRFGSIGPKGSVQPRPSDAEFDPVLRPGQVYLFRCGGAGVWDKTELKPTVPKGRYAPVRYG